MFNDMFGEVLLASSIVLVLKLVAADSFTFFGILGKNERDARMKQKQITSETEVGTPEAAGIISGYPNIATLLWGAVKSCSPMHELGFVVVDGVQDDVWYSEADVQFDDSRWLLSGCVITFVMREFVETGYLRARG
uniref:Uncharacterized protein n=1 Tax=Noctiluca scintillans TaxID=2966 RepID=A0A7S1ANF4_NOCSC|mmetsp:Transcript_5317/g.15147  ORF Transcript_5317/g.15147 Transcript_5317/m.15147 type:complete len:136 (+) Transcript_5317:116-523(+)